MVTEGLTVMIVTHLASFSSSFIRFKLYRRRQAFLQLFLTQTKPIKTVRCADLPLLAGTPAQAAAVLEMNYYPTRTCKRQMLVLCEHS